MQPQAQEYADDGLSVRRVARQRADPPRFACRGAARLRDHERREPQRNALVELGRNLELLVLREDQGEVRSAQQRERFLARHDAVDDDDVIERTGRDLFAEAHLVRATQRTCDVQPGLRPRLRMRAQEITERDQHGAQVAPRVEGADVRDREARLRLRVDGRQAFLVDPVGYPRHRNGRVAAARDGRELVGVGNDARRPAQHHTLQVGDQQARVEGGVHALPPLLVEEARPRVAHVDAVEHRLAEGGQHPGDVGRVRWAAGDDGVEGQPAQQAPGGPGALQHPAPSMIRKPEQRGELPANPADEARARARVRCVVGCRARRRRPAAGTRRAQ